MQINFTDSTVTQCLQMKLKFYALTGFSLVGYALTDWYMSEKTPKMQKKKRYKFG